MERGAGGVGVGWPLSLPHPLTSLPLLFPPPTAHPIHVARPVADVMKDPARPRRVPCHAVGRQVVHGQRRVRHHPAPHQGHLHAAVDAAVQGPLKGAQVAPQQGAVDRPQNVARADDSGHRGFGGRPGLHARHHDDAVARPQWGGRAASGRGGPARGRAGGGQGGGLLFLQPIKRARCRQGHQVQLQPASATHRPAAVSEPIS